MTAVPENTSFPFWQVWGAPFAGSKPGAVVGAVLSQTRKLRSWTRVRCCGLLWTVEQEENGPWELFGKNGYLDNLPVISIIYRVGPEWAGGSPNANPTLPQNYTPV